MRRWRCGAKPSGTSGNGSPPSGAGGSAMDKVGAFDEVLFLGEEVVQNVREGRVGGAEAGGEEILQSAGDYGGDHGAVAASAARWRVMVAWIGVAGRSRRNAARNLAGFVATMALTGLG